MLIEFSVKNFRSIKDEQVFSMVKSPSVEKEETNSFLSDDNNGIRLLRTAVIYGANAAGKSNIINAMQFMEEMVLVSASSVQEGDPIDVVPFLFNESNSKEPTSVEVIFISEGTRYQYGFSCTGSHILEEWLFAYPKGRAQRWYAREFRPEKNDYAYKFSDLLSGKKNVWKESTRANALFLSTAIQLNSEQLKPVFNWFKRLWRPTDAHSLPSNYSASMCEDPKKKETLLTFLKSADFNIHDIKIIKEKFNENHIPSGLPDEVKEKIIKQMTDHEILDIKTIHKTKAGNLVALDLDEESDGTQKFFSLAGPWLDTLENGYVLVIDELHGRLHPRLVRFLVEVFHSKKTNPNNAQLIFTTHETSIMNQDIFRRDQFWFCEKDGEQATTLYPLTDFSPRKDKENIEQGYLSGRYGGVPFVSQFDLK